MPSSQSLVIPSRKSAVGHSRKNSTKVNIVVNPYDSTTEPITAKAPNQALVRHKSADANDNANSMESAGPSQNTVKSPTTKLANQVVSLVGTTEKKPGSFRCKNSSMYTGSNDSDGGQDAYNEPVAMFPTVPEEANNFK